SQCMYVLLIGIAYFCLLMFVFLDSCPCASLSLFSPKPFSPPHTHVRMCLTFALSRSFARPLTCLLSFLC
uniref:Uncharacterized protein n=1 Tax=Amphimedon queenslandica TaxID=400682 RepID=A0A1X7T377_AMPQE